jgi:undecaprenyl diphosphate synthase
MPVADNQPRKGAPSVDGPTPAGLHVAIVMDGNGRWAKKRGLPRTLGHPQGVEAIRRTVRAAPKLGVRWLTLYAFSTENWRRPPGEVSEVMRLMKSYVNSDLEQLAREGVRVRILGRREGLAPDIAEIVARAEARTAANDAFHLQVAFNYGGRADIIDAAKALMAAAARGEMAPEDLDEAAFGARLSTAQAPPLDLLVRTSGEQRLSNFLLWEAAYAEFVFQDVLWPDYGGDHLRAAIEVFEKRERRYGGSVAGDVIAAG